MRPVMQRAAARGSVVWVAALAFSGAAGLIDEICWLRRSALVFGSTTHALSTVLAVFFLGLALGSAVFGRLARRIARPLRACAALELGIALFALLTPLLFTWAERAFGEVYRASAPGAPLLWAARAALVACVLLPPTFLMGGTLPLFVRGVVRDDEHAGRGIAWAYAINTLGAAAGALLAGFALVPRFGMAMALATAAGLNLLAAAGLAATGDVPPADASPAAPVPRAAPAVTALAPGAIATIVFVTGFVALGFEVLWTRFLSLVVHNTVRSATLTIALVLLGIVIGSALASSIADRPRTRAFTFGALQISGGLLVWTLILLPPAWWRALGGEVPTTALLLLPATILSGASLPLAARMLAGGAADAGAAVGSALAANTLGGIAGALVVGFLLLPGLGLESSARACALLGIASGFAAWIWLDRWRSRLLHVVLAATAVVMVFVVPGLTGTRLPADFLAPAGRLVGYREGLESNLAVVRSRAGVLELEADRWWQGQDQKTHQILAAHLPMLLHPDPRRVLVVGVGAGQTPARFTMYPIQRVDCVDIEPRVFDVLRERFAHAWLDDPRVRLLPIDGRNHLAHTADRYDIVSLEVGQLFRPGVASFYSLDFYRRVRERLTPSGLVSQFVGAAFLTPDELGRVIASFIAVFPNATLWYNTSELLLIGSVTTPPVLHSARLARVLADTSIARDLEYSPWGGAREWYARPSVLSAAFLCGPRGLARLAARHAPYRDDPPELEFAASRLRGDEVREVDIAPLLRARLDAIREGSPEIERADEAEAAAIRERNLDDLVAAAYARSAGESAERGAYAGALGLLSRALAANPDDVHAIRLAGDVHVLLGQDDEAERAYRRALAISDRDVRTLAGIGIVALRRGRFAEAAEHLRAALRDGPDTAELRNNLGAALAQSGDMRGALAEFEHALRLEPNDGNAQRNLAMASAALRGTPPSGPPPLRLP